MKYALITGCTRGIGRAISIRLAREGYGLYLNSRHPEDLKALQEELASRFGTVSVLLSCDCGDPEAFASLYNKLVAEPPEVVVNNAGISYIGLLQDMTAASWDQVMNTNVRSVFNTCKAALPAMIRAGKGSIINISSVWGVSGASMEVAYSASKGAVDAFTKALAREVAPSGIRVNALACGVIDTTMNDHLSAAEKQELAEEIGMGRFGRPEEVAETVCWLAGDGASYLTGQVITLDGAFI